MTFVVKPLVDAFTQFINTYNPISQHTTYRNIRTQWRNILIHSCAISMLAQLNSTAIYEQYITIKQNYLKALFKIMIIKTSCFIIFYNLLDLPQIYNLLLNLI